MWVDGTALLATTNDEGRYRLQRVPAGRHTLIARFIGYEITRREVTIVADSTLDQDIPLRFEVARTLLAP